DIQPILESIGIHHPIFDKQKRLYDTMMSNQSNIESKQKIKVFLSYSHAQTEYFKIFKTDLQTYLRIPGKEIEVFQDFEIPLGAKWDEYLQDKVSQCDVMILLVSQEFMNSDYITENEFGKAIKRKDLLISPVYFAPCDFGHETELSALQFYKPYGNEFQQADKGLEFSYIDLVKFKETDGEVIPNANRAHYMKKYTVKLIQEIKNRMK
ncbi:MAG: toll/interleukin-1 receptor domain-containing protein, partial [Chitinophagaceae bacterium]|nr:toll/interleukin-1 receptor domain-containing protein [Chitinophagaceae bacterium]